MIYYYSFTFYIFLFHFNFSSSFSNFVVSFCHFLYFFNMSVIVHQVKLKVYSHQESLLVHLLWSRPNTMLIFFCLVRFAFTPSLYISEPETENKTTRVINIVNSLVHPFKRTIISLEFFSWVSVQLFGAHPSAIAVFTPAQKIRSKRGV